MGMCKIRNLTPHDVVIAREECTVLDERSKKRILVGELQILNLYPEEKETKIPRCDRVYVDRGSNDDGTPLRGFRYGEIDGLPEESPDTLLIVSPAVVEAGLKIGRHDLVSPTDVVYKPIDGGRLIPVGCLSLSFGLE